MILLDKSRYGRLIDKVKQIKINHLFARAVLENQVNGRVYADNAANPRTYYIVHPYGMSLLTGRIDNQSFNSELADYLLNTLKTRKNCEWLQAYPQEWNFKLEEMLGSKLVKYNPDMDSKSGFVEENSRVNFKFNPEKYLVFRKETNFEKYIFQRTTVEMYENMSGTVIPKYFWKNSQQFDEKGIGFSLLIDGIAASTAYSAFIFENQLELGIETHTGYRGKGLAMIACCALIDYCLENNFEPIWSCRFENTASYLLAQKLGFEPIAYIPFYKLNV